MMKAVSSYYYTNLLVFFFSLSLSISLNYHMHNSLKGPNTSSVMISCHVKIFHCHSRDERERCELVSINHTWMWNRGLVFIFFLCVCFASLFFIVWEKMEQIQFSCDKFILNAKSNSKRGLNKSPIHPSFILKKTWATFTSVCHSFVPQLENQPESLSSWCE